MPVSEGGAGLLAAGAARAGAPSLYGGFADVVAVLVLLSAFAMLRAPLIRSQVRLYAFQSLAVVVLSAVVAATHHIGELYALAGLSFVLKVVVVPVIVLRMLERAEVDIASSSAHSSATTTLVGLAVSAIGLFTVGAVHFRSTVLPVAGLSVAVAVVLVSFVLVVMRSDVASQAVGFFSLENGVSVASLVVASRLPVIFEIAFLFDLLVAVVVFGLVMRVHHGRAGTLSTEDLDRLRG